MTSDQYPAKVTKEELIKKIQEFANTFKINVDTFNSETKIQSIIDDLDVSAKELNELTIQANDVSDDEGKGSDEEDEEVAEKEESKEVKEAATEDYDWDERPEFDI